MASIARERVLGCSAAATEYGGNLCTGFEESRGLAINHFEVALFGGVGVVRIHELQHFAFGDDVRGVGHDLHDALRTGRGHHLERTRVDEIADQHARLVAEDGIGGVAAAAP